MEAIMKNVLVLMHDDPGQEARFQVALDLTRVLGGHLSCIDISVVPTFVGDYGDFGGSALLMADERSREQLNRQHMEARLKAEDVPYDYIEATGFLSDCVRDATGVADLVVLNRQVDQINFPDMRALVGEMVIKSRKPIIAAPANVRCFDAFGHALVAWDGSPQAEAALREAVPLLRHASAVTILEIDDGSLQLPASDAASYLSRHGIKPSIRREVADLQAASTMLHAAVTAMRPAYLVMGGFGHSRFIEGALGGVTRRMLNDCPVPLFLMH
jgi:nucleotide-binding universal stress UspA family protein